MSTISMPSAGVPRPRPSEYDLSGRQAWPTMLFLRKWREHESEAPAMIEHFYAIKAAAKRNIDSGVAEGSKPEHGLFESTFDLFENPTQPGLRKLVAWIDETIREVVWVVNGQRDDKSRIRVEFRDAWVHVTNDGGYHDAHRHGDCSWCGIYYVRAGVELREKPRHIANGVSRFYSPLSVGGVVDDYGNAYLREGILDIPPRDGTLLVFPSYLLHAGMPYRGEKDRIVIAFNTKSTLA